MGTSLLLATFLVLLAAVALRITIYAGKYIYQQAPSILAWAAIVLAMWIGGVFETSKELDERIHNASKNARSIESTEDQSRRSGSAKQRNDVEIYPQNASRSKGK
jgi:hypothetical protein